MQRVIVPSAAGGQVLDLDHVAGCHWEKKDRGRRLVVHFVGGRVDMFDGEEADAVFRVLAEDAVPIPLQAR